MYDVFATARQAGFATQSWRARELALLAQTLGAALQARKAVKGDNHSQARATMPASCATRPTTETTPDQVHAEAAAVGEESDSCRSLRSSVQKQFSRNFGMRFWGRRDVQPIADEREQADDRAYPGCPARGVAHMLRGGVDPRKEDDRDGVLTLELDGTLISWQGPPRPAIADLQWL